MEKLRIPEAPSSIQKGVALKMVLDVEAVNQLGSNLQLVYPVFNKEGFINDCLEGIKPLTLTQRGAYIAEIMKRYLPQKYALAISVILKSLTKELKETEGNGLAPMFYMPHCNFISNFGINKSDNEGEDPFDISMNAQYELTKRFTCEFSIRMFLIADEKRTLNYLFKWMNDENPHVRRLASEGTRPRLPWAKKIDSFVKDPSPVLKILELLKDDEDLYVRRSVANHVGDIAKDNIDLALRICSEWLIDADKNVKWVVRHALRNPVKKGNVLAEEIRLSAK